MKENHTISKMSTMKNLVMVGNKKKINMVLIIMRKNLELRATMKTIIMNIQQTQIHQCIVIQPNNPLNQTKLSIRLHKNIKGRRLNKKNIINKTNNMENQRNKIISKTRTIAKHLRKLIISKNRSKPHPEKNIHNKKRKAQLPIKLTINNRKIGIMISNNRIRHSLIKYQTLIMLRDLVLKR